MMTPGPREGFRAFFMAATDQIAAVRSVSQASASPLTLGVRHSRTIAW